METILSPHRSGTLYPRAILIHHTASTAEARATALYFKRLTSLVSAHYVIGRDGEIIRCVPLSKQAWHAGRGEGIPGIVPANRGNKHCVGIELCNTGRGEAYPEAQLAALDRLIAAIDKTLGEKLPIYGHRHYTTRKVDPSPEFPMATYMRYRQHTAPKPEWVRAVVNADTTMRAARSARSEKVRNLAKGNVVRVYSKTAIWSYAEYGGKRGYVLTSKLDF